ncbi:hypothetical protein GCG54_00009595 [Colletotrichum gloeosporioides]|uniref:Uncharacterized protein n=1 Tax=Colletotrichum gloeosporioides TaxID=474922 RepID=A0A8H4FES4_COLGL|nr:uncharacterized protein GCG54_00009595 [Colletotrichum gloeosporioides]KAF3798319.1 hypothetical protein GCG54_00009595 [Colletotrichum gloeosporioides]
MASQKNPATKRNCNRAVYCPYQRDGFMTFGDNYGADPNYVRSDLRHVNFVGQQGASGYAIGGHEEWIGRVCGFTSQVTEDDFVQAREFWPVLGMFDRVSPELGDKIRKAVQYQY